MRIAGLYRPTINAIIDGTMVGANPGIRTPRAAPSLAGGALLVVLTSPAVANASSAIYPGSRARGWVQYPVDGDHDGLPEGVDPDDSRKTCCPDPVIDIIQAAVNAVIESSIREQDVYYDTFLSSLGIGSGYYEKQTTLDGPVVEEAIFLGRRHISLCERLASMVCCCSEGK